MTRTILQFICHHLGPPKKSLITNYYKFSCIQKKLQTQPKLHGKTPPSPIPPSGPTPLGPHFFWICLFVLFVLLLILRLLLLLVFLLRLAAAAAACACFCCLCSCCCIFLLLLLLWLLLLGRRPSNPTHLQCLTFKNGKNNSTIDWNNLTSTNCNKIRWYPTENPREHAPPLPHHPSGPHTPLLNFSGFGPSHSGLLAAVVVKNTPLPLLTFQNVCTDFVAFCAVFGLFCCSLMLAFLVVYCFSRSLCRFRCRFLRFTVVSGVAFVAAASCCCYCLCCCFCCSVVAAAAAGAFKSPTVEKPIFARF